MRRVYLKQIPREEARALFLDQVSIPRREEKIKVTDALLRVTSRAVFAERSMPAYHGAAMDGIAVRAEETFGASDQEPLVLILEEQYLPVDTGDPLPSGFNAVIKVEDVQTLTEQSVEIMSPAAPWQHVRPVGEDVVAKEIILPAYHRLEPVDLGALLAGGITEVPVLKKPKVAIIPTGDELIDPEEIVDRGKIPEFNSTVISGYLQTWGAEPEVFSIVRDEPAELSKQIIAASDRCDLVIINAGSSVGREDFTAQVVQSLGAVFVHGVATRPGKPVVLGKAGEKPLIGLPGYPISAYLALEWFARPLLFRYLGLPEPERPKVQARTGRRIVSELGVEEFIRISVGYVNDRFLINPLNRGAGVTMSLVRADGLLVIPADSLGLEEGEEVEVELFRPTSELRRTLTVVGSHDLTLDLIGTALQRIRPGTSLSSSHVGSMGGITAIKKNQAHLAGVHLFDTATGEYNVPYIKRFLPEESVILVNLAYRTQGWILPSGNPRGIKKVTDLLQDGVTFVNRQRGAGTRLLFDHLLAGEGIDPGRICGYQREEYTHLNVAAAVAAGAADVGLGILSAAHAYGLDFVPVSEERYDLLMRKDFYYSAFGQDLIRVITSPEFKEQVEALGGYSLRDAGKIMYEHA
ncbi:MAG TPA: molybdopterin biosynthesis protein [Firmicutes bacterium]|nr:molybdopterin biosynthesis protein [Bacillota bacterium]